MSPLPSACASVQTQSLWTTSVKGCCRFLPLDSKKMVLFSATGCRSCQQCPIHCCMIELTLLFHGISWFCTISLPNVSPTVPGNVAPPVLLLLFQSSHGPNQHVYLLFSHLFPILSSHCFDCTLSLASLVNSYFTCCYRIVQRNASGSWSYLFKNFLWKLSLSVVDLDIAVLQPKENLLHLNFKSKQFKPK